MGLFVVFLFFFLFFFCFCFWTVFHSALPLLESTLQGSFNFSYLSFLLSSVSFWSFFFFFSPKYYFHQWPEVTLCGWWYIKIKELSRSTHLFLVMFFSTHHRAPFCSEYFPLFFLFLFFVPFFLPTYCQWFSSFQLHKFSPWDYLLVLMFFTFIAFFR